MYTRRKFIQRSGAAALLAPGFLSLGACDGLNNFDSENDLDDAAWDELERMLPGKVVRPGQPMYSALGLPRNLAYSDIRPRGIVRCADSSDLSVALTWARAHNIPAVPRSPAAHSYGGYSATHGLSLDLSALSSIALVEDKSAAILGAGAMLGPIARELWRDGRLFPAGQCESVGVSGLMLAGGIGFNARRYGMTCDQLIQAKMIDAQGMERIAGEGPGEDANLLWALRGGGGGTFGVCTSFKVRVYDLSEAQTSVFRLRWRGRENVALAFAAMQQIALSAPHDFSMLATLTMGTELELRAQGQFYGSLSDLQSLLEPFPVRTSPRDEQWGSSNLMDGTRFLGEVGIPNAFQTKSAFYEAALPPEGIATLLDWMALRPSTARAASTTFFAYGGKMTAPDAPPTAYVHRSGAFLQEGCVSWYPGSSAATEDELKQWLAYGFEAMKPWTNGFAFANFIDRSLPDGVWEWAYYGQNFQRLREIKRDVDPDNFFQFQQSIPPAS